MIYQGDGGEVVWGRFWKQWTTASDSAPQETPLNICRLAIGHCEVNRGQWPQVTLVGPFTVFSHCGKWMRFLIKYIGFRSHCPHAPPGSSALQSQSPPASIALCTRIPPRIARNARSHHPDSPRRETLATLLFWTARSTRCEKPFSAAIFFRKCAHINQETHKKGVRIFRVSGILWSEYAGFEGDARRQLHEI